MNTRKKKSMPKAQSNPNPAAGAFVTADQVVSSNVPYGARIGVAALIEEAARKFELGVAHEEKLLRGQWTPQRNQALSDDAASLHDSRLRYREKQKATQRKTAQFKAVVAESVLLRDELATALPIVTKGSKSPLKESRLHLTGTLKSARLLALWLEEVLVEVKEHKAALATLFRADPVALTQAQFTKLTGALGKYASARVQIGDLAAEQKAARVKVVQAIMDQRQAAAFAFVGDPKTLEQFVPIWVKKKAAAKGSTSASPAEPAQATPKPAEASPPPAPAAAPT